MGCACSGVTGDDGGGRGGGRWFRGVVGIAADESSSSGTDFDSGDAWVVVLMQGSGGGGNLRVSANQEGGQGIGDCALGKGSA